MNLRGEIGGPNYGSSTYYIKNRVDLNNKINETGLCQTNMPAAVTSSSVEPCCECYAKKNNTGKSWQYLVIKFIIAESYSIFVNFSPSSILHGQQIDSGRLFLCLQCWWVPTEMQGINFLQGLIKQFKNIIYFIRDIQLNITYN